MKLALNGATIMHSPLAEDVEIAAACGYDAIEIWAGKLDGYLAGHSLEELGGRLSSLGIQPWCINSIENITPRDAAGRAAVFAELRAKAAVARAIGAPAIVVVPGRAPEAMSRSERVHDAVEMLRAMSDIAGEVGLAFEFLGKPGCAVPSLDLAIDIVGEAGCTNVGMVIDTFHFYAGGSSMADLDRVPIDRLFVVHLNGCEDRPTGELTDAHRLYPGEGVIPSEEILWRLRNRGFDGVVSIEIFRPEYWEQDAREVARTAKAKAEAILTKAGYTLDG
jgi:2-keto-myo-inositol isomerase